MQSGTTFGSIPRIYNPIKQSLEKDPNGAFIRRWVPELRSLGDKGIHYPDLTNRHDYPSAIIDPENLWNIMRANGPKSASPRNAASSRRSPVKRNALSVKKASNEQLDLFLTD
jgi:hypothetical protein